MDPSDKKGVPVSEGQTSLEGTTDATDAYTYHDDSGYTEHDSVQTEPSNLPATTGASQPPPPSTPPVSHDEEDPDEEGMLRMSFMEHLDELRRRIIRALMGIGIAFGCSLYFTDRLWKIIQQPFKGAMAINGIPDAKLVVTGPMEAFSIIWIKLPILCALFIASPWILYQVWSFIAPGLYKRERRWAVPFIFFSASLFLLGGTFAYFVAFKLGLGFLLGIALVNDLTTMVSITDYFDLFFNVMLGMGLVFEIPILIFFLSLLRILSPAFLVRNSRYALLIIVVLAAIVTPTPDVVNLMLISVPMTLLYFVGVFASYLLWLSREGKRFPWGWFLLIIGGLTLLIGGSLYLAIAKYGYKLVNTWPYLVR